MRSAIFFHNKLGNLCLHKAHYVHRETAMLEQLGLFIPLKDNLNSIAPGLLLPPHTSRTARTAPSTRWGTKSSEKKYWPYNV